MKYCYHVFVSGEGAVIFNRHLAEGVVSDVDNFDWLGAVSGYCAPADDYSYWLSAAALTGDIAAQCGNLEPAAYPHEGDYLYTLIFLDEYGNVIPGGTMWESEIANKFICENSEKFWEWLEDNPDCDYYEEFNRFMEY